MPALALSRTGLGLLIGAAAGIWAQVRSHVIEDRVEGVALLTWHVLADLDVSALGAALVLAGAIGWVAITAPRRTSEGDRSTPL